MNVGFTGTRKGMTFVQKRELAQVLDNYIRTSSNPKFLHGKCIGADEQAATIAKNKQFITVAYPSDRTEQTSVFVSTIEMPLLKHPLERNKDIVRDCDILIACPNQSEEPTARRAGGTWWTIRWARAHYKDKLRIILWPDGRVEVDN